MRYRHAPAHAYAAPVEGEAIGGINTTPLIDVMLVLLVMFIITIPAMTHQVPIDLPQPAPDRTRPITTHRLELLPSGALRLDGAPVAPAALEARLATLRADPQASLILAPDPAVPYAPVAETLATVKRAGVTRLGFEGNEGFAGL